MQRELKSTSTQCQNANWDECHTVWKMKAALIRAHLYPAIRMNRLTFAQDEKEKNSH